MALDSRARKAIAEPVDRRGANVQPMDPRAGAVSMAQLEVSAAAAEPPWSSFPRIDFREWRRFSRYPNFLAAHIVAGLLENEGVPTIVESYGVFPGADSSAIWVPKELMHRARWILALSPSTDAELLFLATGELQSANEAP
jgi:hypothetical protein